MDYFTILNFDKEPFSNSPDPEIFFQSRQHMSCLQKLELSIRMRRGLNVVIGEVGTGKTTLCRQLIRKFDGDKQVQSHLILDPDFSTPMEFLLALAEMFLGQTPVANSTDRQLKEQIKNYLYSQGVDDEKITLIIVDEGQKLPDFCLETLRELLNYETNDYKLLQIVIFAQREFEETLESYKNFTDRINLHHTLKAFDFSETRAMITFRLDEASIDGQCRTLFNYPALWVIYQVTGGYPRKIINLCHLVILTMIIQGRKKAGWFLALSCAGKVFPERAKRLQRMRSGALAGMMIVVLAAGLEAAKLSKPLPAENAPELATMGNPPLPTAPDLKPSGPAEPESFTPHPDDKIAALIIKNQTTPITTPIMEAAPEPLPVPTPAPAVQLPHKEFPEFLGEIDVRPGETMGDMVRKLYGPWSFNKKNTKTVLEANPHVESAHLLAVGDVVLFPAVPVRLTPLATRVLWVKINQIDRLDNAYRYLRRQAKDSPPMLIIPSWNDQGALEFTILLEEYFGDMASAKKMIESLPADLGAGAQLLSGLDRNRFFYQ